MAEGSSRATEVLCLRARGALTLSGFPGLAPRLVKGLAGGFSEHVTVCDGCGGLRPAGVRSGRTVP